MHSSIIAAVEDGGPYSSTSDCEVRSVMFLNIQSIAPGLLPYITQWSTLLLQEFSWEVFNHNQPQSLDLKPSDFNLFLHLKEFLSGSISIFRMTGGDECHSSFQSQAADLYDTGYRSWSHRLTDVSILEVNMLKNSSTLAISVPINWLLFL